MTKEELKQYRIDNKAKIKANRKKHYDNNKKTILANNTEYRKTHVLKDRKEYVKQYNKDYKKKLLNDPLRLLQKRISTAIYNSFRKKGLTKKTKTIEILGCTYNEFKLHLEKQFESWMNWENKGLYNKTLNYGWDIDHIIPISTAKTTEDIIRLNHYTNLRPLCSHTNRNIKKGKF